MSFSVFSLIINTFLIVSLSTSTNIVVPKRKIQPHEVILRSFVDNVDLFSVFHIRVSSEPPCEFMTLIQSEMDKLEENSSYVPIVSYIAGEFEMDLTLPWIDKRTNKVSKYTGVAFRALDQETEISADVHGTFTLHSAGEITWLYIRAWFLRDPVLAIFVIGGTSVLVIGIFLAICIGDQRWFLRSLRHQRQRKSRRKVVIEKPKMRHLKSAIPLPEIHRDKNARLMLPDGMTYETFVEEDVEDEEIKIRCYGLGYHFLVYKFAKKWSRRSCCGIETMTIFMVLSWLSILVPLFFAVFLFVCVLDCCCCSQENCLKRRRRRNVVGRGYNQLSDEEDDSRGENDFHGDTDELIVTLKRKGDIAKRNRRQKGGRKKNEDVNKKSDGKKKIFGRSIKCREDVPKCVKDLQERIKLSKLKKGIFREGGSSAVKDQMERDIENEVPVSELNGTIFELCKVLGRFYGKMLEPLLSYALYERLIKLVEMLKIADGEGKIKMQMKIDSAKLKELIEELDQVNYEMLKDLMAFFVELVSEEKKNVTKMDAKNIASTFAPNIIRPRVLPKDPKQAMFNTFVHAKIVETLIKDYENVFFN